MTRPIVSLILIGLAACGGGSHEAEPAPAVETAPVAVRTATLAPETTEQTLPLVGTVEAREEIAVAARIMSRIERIAVSEGSYVKAGDPIATLDDRELRAGLEAAEAAGREADSAIRAAGHQIAAAEAQVRLAQRTHDRFAGLFEKESVTRQELDEAEARLEGARAALETARAGQAQAQAKRAQAEAAATRARTQLDYAQVTAPAAGRVVERLLDPGALAAPGQPIVRIEQAGGYRLAVAAPESVVGRLRIGATMPVEITALGEAGAFDAKVVEIVPTVDPGARSFTVKLALPSNPLLRSGLYGRALLAGEERASLTVPAAAVVERGQLTSVFVAADGRARRRLVTLGERRGEAFEVLSGLSAGDEVILNPGEVRDGGRVTGGRS